MKYKLKSVALHITNECSAKCPMCYYTSNNETKCEGDFETLKQIAQELKKYGVEEINLVGGDPAEYSKIEELVKYLYNLGFQIPILSNTHSYKNSTIERITPYVSSLEGTFHAPTASEHNAFNQTVNSYEIMLDNLKTYDKLRNHNQKLGAVLNVMNHNFEKLYEIIYGLLEKGLNLNYVLIQRIGMYGRAKDDAQILEIKNKLNKVFEQIARINEELGIETSMVDAFPLCLISDEYHKYLSSCEWGINTASIDMTGNITRCAVADHSGSNLLGNILDTPLQEIWTSSDTLISFRNKDYLNEECQKCINLPKCGGGCPISNGNNTLSSDILIRARK